MKERKQLEINIEICKPEISSNANLNVRQLDNKAITLAPMKVLSRSNSIPLNRELVEEDM